jgi:hypothetical protein
MNVIRDVMVFLDEHAGALQAVFALVVAASTVAYVRYTKRMWAEMRETNRQLNKADIQIGFEPGSASKTVWDLVIRNTGYVALLDVSLSVDPPDFPGLGGTGVGGLAIFSRHIPILLPKGEIRTAFLNLIPALRREDGRLKFRARYHTSLHPETAQEFVYDLKAYEGLGWVSEAKPDDFLRITTEIGRTLTLLNQSIRDLSEELRAEIGGLQSHDNEEDLKNRLQGYVGVWRDAKSRGDEAFMEYPLAKLRAQCERLADQLSEVALNHPILAAMRPKLREMSSMHFYSDGGESLRKFQSLGDEVSEVAKVYLASEGAP